MDNSPQFLDRPAGRIAYDVRGSGPLVVAVSGMSDLRSTYRHLVGPLAEAGFRVATMELRGHGDSDSTFREYGVLVGVEVVGPPTRVQAGQPRLPHRADPRRLHHQPEQPAHDRVQRRVADERADQHQ